MSLQDFADAPAFRPPRAPPRVLAIHEAAETTQLTHRALRFYEERGLIRPDRDRQGARAYDKAMVERLRFIALARRAGVTLRDIGLLLEVEAAEGVVGRDRKLSDCCDRRLKTLDHQRREVLAVAQAMSRGGHALEDT